MNTSFRMSVQNNICILINTMVFDDLVKKKKKTVTDGHIYKQEVSERFIIQSAEAGDKY